MKFGNPIPWDQYGLIVELAKRLHGVSPQFGKTVLQKMVFLLQEAYGIDCGYDFQLYTYGPFDASLLGDLDHVEILGGVKVQSVASLTGGYDISPAEKAEEIRGKGKEFLDQTNVKEALDHLIMDFGRFNATDLELRTTSLKVAHELNEDRGRAPSIQEVRKIVQEIKPKFTPQQIDLAIRFLQEKQLIELSD